MGKKTKAGTKGEITQYTTRSKAIRKLQISLKDFRRLCILKGVYPREPKRKMEGTNKTYYHVKDINYLAHEKILEKFREIKTSLKKYKRHLRRDDPEKAKKIKENMPTYTLNHLIKERYPSFADALRDLDDPLCLINLFAAFQAHKTYDIPNDKIQLCVRLSKEFNYYVVKSRSLRKVFLSIKGIYYQAEIQGQTVTWIVPYQFTQKLPANVDYKVMMTFLEFYEILMKFVNFKLYSSINLNYPPRVNQDLEKTLDSFCYSTMIVENKESNVETEIQEEKYQISNEFKKDETLRLINDKYNNETGNLFQGLVFFCNREVPRYSLEFVILAFGGQVLWDSDNCNIDDKRITHVITDRDPKFIKVKPNREYIQPQWVYDSINNKMPLPISDYAPGKILPPHLSPFADAAEEGGYKPDRQVALEKLRGDYVEDEEENLEEEKVQVDEEEEEVETYEHEKEVEKKKKKAKSEEQEALLLSQTVMPKKKKRMFDMIMANKKNLKQKGMKLKMKRDKLKKMNKMAVTEYDE
jgi:pescadillo protein